MSSKSIKKLYYSISEVAKKTDLKQYVLRYWETEFEELKPSKNRAGNRIYKEKDIDLIVLIRELLYDKKFTIEGARNYLKNNGSSTKSSNGKSVKSKDELFISIKTELESVLKMLDSGN